MIRNYAGANETQFEYITFFPFSFFIFIVIFYMCIYFCFLPFSSILSLGSRIISLSKGLRIIVQENRFQNLFVKILKPTRIGIEDIS